MIENDLIRIYWKFKNSRDSNKRLQLWTVAPGAHAQSQNNFVQLLDHARRQGCEYMILDAKYVQFLGGSANLRKVFTPSWAEKFDQSVKDSDYYHGISDRLDRHVSIWQQQRLVSQIRFWIRMFVTDQHRGFWHVNTGERMTNRLDQMDVIWAAGFLARRGRPLSCAQPSQFGSRDSIEHLSRLDRRQLGSSDHIYSKLDQLYRSVNRDCCWPSDP